MTNAKTPTATNPQEEPRPGADEDSVPQDEGTDNSWQMEPLADDKSKDSAS